LADILFYVGKNADYATSVHKRKYIVYENNSLPDFIAQHGILAYGSIDPEFNYVGRSNMTLKEYMLNCIFDRTDCSNVLAYPFIHAALGEQCIAFGLA
jgi:hypothetical protein